MSQLIDPGAQPHWIANARSMNVIIQQIKQEPIAEAQVLIKENIFHASHMVIPSPRETPLGSRKSSKQQLATVTRETDARSDRLSPLDGAQGSSETQALSSRTGAMVLRKKERETRPVFHDYGDGNRETYEVGSSISFSDTGQRGRRDLSTNIYVPVPPFNSSDWQLRKQKKRGS